MRIKKTFFMLNKFIRDIRSSKIIYELSDELFGKLELFGSINKELFDKIRTISYSLADRGLKKEAFKIERMLKDLNGRSK